MNNNQHILVTFNTNWADEMDITGWKVMTEKEWQNFQDGIPEEMFPTEIYFGTNEANEYDDKETFLAEYSTREITDVQAAVLDTLFQGQSGEFPTLEYQIADYIEESNIERGDED